MKHSFDIRPWLKPALTSILGLVLIFKPSSLTFVICKIIGIVLALFGAGKMVRWISISNREFRKHSFWQLAIGIVLLLVGFAILKNPVSLEQKAGRLIGLLLLLQAIRGYVDPYAAHDRVSSTVLCVLSLVLLVMPVAVSRLTVIICGIVVLAVGIGMGLDVYRFGGGSGHSGGDIIDAE